MILGLGIDLVEVPRIGRSISTYGERFLQRIFTGAERAYAESKENSVERFAARFAAKEAALKAFGTGMTDGISWTELEVINSELGKPGLRFHGNAAKLIAEIGVHRVSVSLTHTKQAASAIVIFED